MKKPILALFSAVVLGLSLVFVGCGQTDTGLKIALDVEDEGRYDELFAYFTAETGIEISATYGQDISKLVGTKDEPDIIKTSTVLVVSMKGTLLDLSDRIAADPDINPDDYLESLMDALTIDGKIYALPTSINTSLLYYNKALFDASANQLRVALGLGPEDSVYPQADWTYDDYQTAGIALTKSTMQGDELVYTQFGAETQLNWWGEWFVYVRQMGGTFYVPDSNNRICALDSAEALAATTFFVAKSMGDATEKFAPDAVEAVGGFSFVSGNVAMIFGGHTGDWYTYDSLGLDWDVQVLPTPVGMPTAQGGEISADAFGISVRSDKADAAFLFLKTWAGTAGALQMYKYGKIGALKSMESLIDALPESEQKEINITAVFTAMDIALTLPAEKDFAKVMREIVMAELYKLMYTGRGAETDVSVVLNRIKANVDDYYQRLYD
ncbi:MAG: extracellular solute-binding protein [bacterium]